MRTPRRHIVRILAGWPSAHALLGAYANPNRSDLSRKTSQDDRSLATAVIGSSASGRHVEEALWVEAVDIADERRVKAVADQFLHPGRECAGDVRWDR